MKLRNVRWLCAEAIARFWVYFVRKIQNNFKLSAWGFWCHIKHMFFSRIEAVFCLLCLVRGVWNYLHKRRWRIESGGTPEGSMWPAAGSSPPPERTQPTPSASHSLCGGVDLTLKAEVLRQLHPYPLSAATLFLLFRRALKILLTQKFGMYIFRQSHMSSVLPAFLVPFVSIHYGDGALIINVISSKIMCYMHISWCGLNVLCAGLRF